jgi:hypothetical protein
VGLLVHATPVVALLIVGCAAVAPPSNTPLIERSDVACELVHGSSEGLLLELTVHHNPPAGAVVAIYRNDDELVAFPLADVASFPYSVPMLDPNITPGSYYRYGCALWSTGERLAYVEVGAMAISAPGTPATPAVRTESDHVVIEWGPTDGLRTTVLRRDILAGTEQVIISPILGSNSWLDFDVEAGGVYAYATQTSVQEGELRWRSDPGPEQYIEVP